MITADDVKQTLARCAGYDPAHFPKRSEVILLAWMDHMQQFPYLTGEDLAGAVREYYNQPSRPVPQPADISALARKYSRERYERSDLESVERQRLEALCDAKAAPDMPALEAAGFPSDAPPAQVGGNHTSTATRSATTPQSRRRAIDEFAIEYGKRKRQHVAANDVEAQALVEHARRSAPPTPIPCPDCGSTDPCECEE